jgi:hypothetical protein
MKLRSFGIVISISSAILLISLTSLDKDYYVLPNGNKGLLDFPDSANTLFAGSGKCVGCHGYDPEGLSSRDEEGNDVNVSDAWAATMMANAAKDPFWRAKVSHEISVNPSHQVDLENTCTKCHAPLGHFNAIHNGQSHYSIAEMEVDSIALDGVSCSACHQLDTALMGQAFSGNLIYDTTRTIFGPFPNPFSSPMQGLVGFDVVHSEKISTSLACATCHSLITQSVDTAGNYNGTSFVEQATYHEWLNSIYDQDETRQECQHCHVPRIEDEVALALDYSFIGGRSPFGKHEFSGANIFMLKLMQNNIDELGINASAVNYDSAITRTERLLRDCTLVLSLNELDRTQDSVYYALSIRNKAGHKFPSGYPSRRATVQFIVKNENGDTLFFNGAFDENFEVIGHSLPYEEHHSIIRNEEDVQIYEMVFGDSNGDKTTILERGNSVLKDNRIVPEGFTTAHISYDTVAIVGNAASDIDFNYTDDTEGSGSDLIYFTVALNSYSGPLNTRARIYYQTAPPAWMTEMFEHETEEILQFKSMFDAADRSPFLVAEARLDSVSLGINDQQHFAISLYPNPSNGRVYIENKNNLPIFFIELYSINGQLIKSVENVDFIDLPTEKGIYIIRLIGEGGRDSIKRIVRY